MANSKIEWLNSGEGKKGMVWNPVTGCTKISAGCANCYAERMSKRLAGRFGYPLDSPFKVTLHPDRLDDPMKWKKPQMVFVNSMGDLFHEDVPFDFVCDVFARMEFAAHHTFLILTKRPERMKKFFQEWSSKNWPLANVWLGITVENQGNAGERIQKLQETKAVVRFISFEPLLGEIKLTKEQWKTIDWVIVGGETGPGARPMHPDWVMSLRDQTQVAGVSFFFKQWGEWIVPEDGAEACRVCGCTWNNACNNGCYWVEPGLCNKCVGKPIPNYRAVKYVRVGKKNAGRMLDGRTWNEMPAQVKKTDQLVGGGV